MTMHPRAGQEPCSPSLTSCMKPLHWRYRKCQRSRRRKPSSVVAPDDSHQARIARYWVSASDCVEAFLYCLHRRRCWSWRSARMSALVCFSMDCTQWNKQVRSLFGIGIDASPLPYTMRIAFQFACALSATKHLKFGFSTPWRPTTALRFFQTTI